MKTLSKVLWIVLGLCFKLAASNLGLEDQALTIETCRPHGLKVSYQHVFSIEKIEFHANINKPITISSNGQIVRQLHKQGNKWVYTDPTVELKPGDKIYYWFFIQDDLIGYRFGNKVFEVKECSQKNKEFETSTTTEIEQKMLLDFIVKLYECQKENDSTKETNTILRDLLGKNSETRTTLTLDGPLPNDTDLRMMVQDIITQKLGLHIRVETVTRNDDGKANFQVATLDDKIAIIKASKEKLQQSRFSILY